MRASKLCERDGCNSIINVKWAYLLKHKKYCSPECKSLARKGTHYSEVTKQKMRHPHKKPENYIVWNRGLTKETNESVKKGSEKGKQTKQIRKEEGKIYTSWSKGLTRVTDNRIDKVARQKEGVKRPREVVDRINNKLRGRVGRKWTEEEKYNQSVRCKGRINSPKSRIKNSIAHTGKVYSEETQQKKSLALTGKKHSKTTREKQSIKRLEYLESHKQEFKWFNTKVELKVKELFNKYNILFIHQKKVGKYLYDFYLSDFNLLIEVDGVYHHGKIKSEKGYSQVQLKIMERDKLKTELALQRGYLLKRVWSDEVDKFEEYIKENLLR